MRKTVALLAALLFLGAVPTALAQEKPKIDAEALWRELQQQPIVVLPKSAARFDAERVRAEIQRTKPKLKGDIYIVVAPFKTSRYDVRKPLEPLMDDGDVLITVSGIEVNTDWFKLADGKYYGSGPEGRYEDAVNRRHEAVVRRTYDVTAPIVDILRLARGAEMANPQKAPRRAEADKAMIDRLAAGLEKERTYVAEELLSDGRKLRNFAPFPPPDESVLKWRAVYLPPSEPGKPVEDPIPGLTQRFPEDNIVVVRGAWVDAAGPGNQRAIATSLRYARAKFAQQSLWLDMQSSQAEAFFDRLGQIKRGILDPRGIPVRPPSVEQTGGQLGPWAFAITGVAIGGASVGGWLWRRARKRRAELRAMRLGSAELAAELAKLAAEITTAGDRRRKAEAAERYATAVDLSEQATSSAELDVAREVVREAHAILDGTR